jgi:hypothetical protein
VAVNIGAIADRVIDALVEIVIAANTRSELVMACKALDKMFEVVPH